MNHVPADETMPCGNTCGTCPVSDVCPAHSEDTDVDPAEVALFLAGDLPAEPTIRPARRLREAEAEEAIARERVEVAAEWTTRERLATKRYGNRLPLEAALDLIDAQD